MKKAIFSVMNYLLPQRDVLPMHCSANVGATGDVALFFGLSGTGKTTLSADPARRLIGDDEHGWSDHSVFNFEGGCYAKTIRLSPESEPQIYNAIRFGSILENVVVDPQTRAIDYDSDFLTENTRATYPDRPHPRTPCSAAWATTRATSSSSPATPSACCRRSRELTPEMASYHFLSGFTSKVAGTEVGIDEPRPTFSACFGAPFMPLHASRYATMLAERLSWHETDCWLVNTGWTGGPYGVGHRMSIELTRALIGGGSGRLARGVRLHAAPGLQGARAARVRRRRGRRARPARDAGPTGPPTTRPPAELAGMFSENFEQYAAHVSGRRCLRRGRIQLEQL